MTFLNLILLGGAAAAVIPFLIHLFHRSRFQAIPWGAMQFLRTSASRKRRVRIEQWILLAVRAAILLFLALCMARPVLTGLQSLLGDAKSSVVVLLDNSLSMTTGENGRSRFSRACGEAGAMLAALPRGSEMAVAWLAGAAAPVSGPTFDAALLQGSLGAQKAVQGEANPAAALDTAAGLLARAHYADREVLVVSDFQQANWSTENRAAWSRSLESLCKGPLKPRLTFLPVAREAQENVAVEELALSRAIAGLNQKIQVRATVRNYGARRLPETRVYFRVDGDERAVSLITLEPRASAQVLFTHAFERAGSHICEVATDTDALLGDNARRAGIAIWDRLPVLLISDDPGGGRQDDALFLQAALQPYRTAGESGTLDLIDVRTASLARGGLPDLSGVRVIVFSNVRELPYQWLNKTLELFVREGGAILVFPGNRTRPDAWRRAFNDQKNRYLPACFGALAGVIKDRGKPTAIAAQRFEHPALSLFNDPRNGTLGGCEIRNWYPLLTSRPPAPPPRPKRNGRQRVEPEKPAPEGKTVVLARLASGDPFLVEKDYGRGRVIFCATSADDTWSNLPARPCYLPLMQQLVLYLASRDEAQATLEIGQPLAWLLPQSSGAQTPGSGDAGAKPAILTDPVGQAHELNPRLTDNGAVLEFGQTFIAGTYTLASAHAGGNAVQYAVNTPPRESDPALLSRAELESLARESGARILDSAGQYENIDRKRRFGFEFWKPLLALVLGLVFLELILEQRFARRTT